MTQFNLANTKLHLGKLEGRRGEFVEARKLYCSSLECLSEKTTSLQRAMAQTNLGVALEAIAGTGDLKLLTEAAQAYKAVVGVMSPENNPRMNEVATQNLERVLQIIKKLEVSNWDLTALLLAGRVVARLGTHPKSQGSRRRPVRLR